MNPELEGKNALVIFLHGSNIRGADNAIPLVLSPVHDLVDYAADNDMKAILLVPQADVPMVGPRWTGEAEQAALPVAFAGERDINRLLQTPLMVVAGEMDDLGEGVTNPEAITVVVDQLKATGAEIEIEYMIMPGLDHNGVCENAFTEEHLDWLFGGLVK